MENKNVESVENTSQNTQQETQPVQSNFEAKEIRESSERRIFKKLGVEDLSQAQQLLEEANKLKQQQLTEEERLAEERAKVQQELEEQKQTAMKLQKENKLRALGVPEEQLNDAVNLTNGLSDEELKNKVELYFKPNTNTIPSNLSQKQESNNSTVDVDSIAKGMKFI